MSRIVSPIKLKEWIDQNREKLKPPVCNQIIYEDADFIVMVIGGPNIRKDYHYNSTPELFYQVEGNMVLKIIEDKEFKDIAINEGELFYLPPNIPHSPQRSANTVGLVIEQRRPAGVKDAMMWYCDNCKEKIYTESFELKNIVEQLPVVLNGFYDDEQKRCCAKCGAVMQDPRK